MAVFASTSFPQLVMAIQPWRIHSFINLPKHAIISEAQHSPERWPHPCLPDKPWSWNMPAHSGIHPSQRVPKPPLAHLLCCPPHLHTYCASFTPVQAVRGNQALGSGRPGPLSDPC